MLREKEPVRLDGLGWREGFGLRGDLACLIGKFACEQLSREGSDVEVWLDGFFSYLLNLRV